MSNESNSELKAVDTAVETLLIAACMLRLRKTACGSAFGLIRQITELLPTACPVPSAALALRQFGDVELTYREYSDHEFFQTLSSFDKELRGLLRTSFGMRSEPRPIRDERGVRIQQEQVSEFIVSCFRESFTVLTEKDEIAYDRREREKQRLSINNNRFQNIICDDPIDLAQSIIAAADIRLLLVQLQGELVTEASDMPALGVRNLLKGVSSELHQLFDQMRPVGDELAAQIRRSRTSLMPWRWNSRRLAGRVFSFFEDELDRLQNEYLVAIDASLSESASSSSLRIIDELHRQLSWKFAGQLLTLPELLSESEANRACIDRQKHAKPLEAVSTSVWRRVKQTFDLLVRNESTGACLKPSIACVGNSSDFELKRLQALALIFVAIRHTVDDADILQKVRLVLNQMARPASIADYDDLSICERFQSNNVNDYFILQKRGEVSPTEWTVGVVAVTDGPSAVSLWAPRIPKFASGRFINLWLLLCRQERWCLLRGRSNTVAAIQNFRDVMWYSASEPKPRENDSKQLCVVRDSAIFVALRNLLVHLVCEYAVSSDDFRGFEEIRSAFSRAGIKIDYPGPPEIAEQFGLNLAGDFLRHITCTFQFETGAGVEREDIHIVQVPACPNALGQRLLRDEFRIPRGLQDEAQRTVRALAYELLKASEADAALVALELLNVLESAGSEGSADDVQRAAKIIREGLSNADLKHLVPAYGFERDVLELFKTYYHNIAWTAQPSEQNQLEAIVIRHGLQGGRDRGQVLLRLPISRFNSATQTQLVNLFHFDHEDISNGEGFRICVLKAIAMHPSTDLKDALREWYRDVSNRSKLPEPILAVLIATGSISDSDLEGERKAAAMQILIPKLEQLEAELCEALAKSTGNSPESPERVSRFNTLQNAFHKIGCRLLPGRIDNFGRCERCEVSQSAVTDCYFIRGTRPGELFVRKFGLDEERKTEIAVSAGEVPPAFAEFSSFVESAHKAGLNIGMAKSVQAQWPSADLKASESIDVFRRWFCEVCLQTVASLMLSGWERSSSESVTKDLYNRMETLHDILARYALEKGKLSLKRVKRQQDLGTGWREEVELADGQTEWPKNARSLMVRPIVKRADGTLYWKGQVRIL